jgi:hypothetical protein
VVLLLLELLPEVYMEQREAFLVLVLRKESAIL